MPFVPGRVVEGGRWRHHAAAAGGRSGGVLSVPQVVCRREASRVAVVSPYAAQWAGVIDSGTA